MLTIVLLCILSLFITALAAFFNAIMDSCDHKMIDTIFYRDPNLPKKYVFGTEWNIWFGVDQMWLNKYKNRDPRQGLKTRRIFLWDVHIVQLEDVWHFSKSLMIGVFLLHVPVALLIGINIQHYSGGSVLAIVSGLYCLNAIIWNVSFLYYYTRGLIRR